MGFENPVVGGTALRIPAIQSPNYSPGTAGWIIKINGDAEFNNLTVRGTFVGQNFILNSDGLFVYNGTPAAGNLAFSIAPAAGTDDFGNAYLQGSMTYDMVGGFAGIQQGTFYIGEMSDGFPTAALVGAVGTSGITILSPIINEPDRSALTLTEGDDTLTWSDNGYPRLDADGTFRVQEAAVKATGTTIETWHTPTFSGSWVTTGTLNGNSTFRGMQYRKDAEDNVWVLGAATTTAAGGSIFTLPSGYFNASRRHLLPCFIFDSSAGAVVSGFAQVTETGVVNIAASLAGVTIATGDQVFINGKFPLGNLT